MMNLLSGLLVFHPRINQDAIIVQESELELEDQDLDLQMEDEPYDLYLCGCDDE